MGILAVEPLPIPLYDPDMATCLLSFNELTFDQSYFKLAAIFQPPAISRSVMKRQAEFFFGRLAAKFAMSVIGVDKSDVPIGSSGEPIWPLGYVGSITHTAGLAAAVIACKKSAISGIGIDIERVVKGRDLDALHALVIDGQERSCLQTASAIFSDDILATLAFSAKESVYKGAFASVGRFFDFAAARIAEPPDVAGRLSLVITENLGTLFTHGRLCKVDFRLLRPDVVFTSFVL